MYKDDGLYYTLPSVSWIKQKMEPIEMPADGRQDERTNLAGFQLGDQTLRRTV